MLESVRIYPANRVGVLGDYTATRRDRRRSKYLIGYSSEKFWREIRASAFSLTNRALNSQLKRRKISYCHYTLPFRTINPNCWISFALAAPFCPVDFSVFVVAKF